MDTALCSCRSCDSEIGELINLWTKIGKTYFSPVVDPDEGLAVLCQGEVRVGEGGTLVQGCHLQDVVCTNCASLLGLICVATPVNHVLDENQILFKVSSLLLANDKGAEVEFVIKRVLDVREPSKGNNTAGSFPGTSNGEFTPPPFTEVVDIFKLQAELESQRNVINQIDRNGVKIISALNKRVTDAEQEVGSLKGSLNATRHGITGVQDDITSLKTEVNDIKQLVEPRVPSAGLEERLCSVTSTLKEVRHEVDKLAGRFDSELLDLKVESRKTKEDIESIRSHINGSMSSRQHAKDMAAVLAELSQLRRHVDDLRSKRPEPTSTPFPSRELEILTSNIAKIGSRASQVETLQMEIEIMKGRVERVEAGNRQNLNPETRQPQQRFISQELFPPPRRKLDSLDVEATGNREPPPKRPAISPGYLETPTRSQDPSPEPKDNRKTVPAKPTKSSKVDKRYLRGRKPLNNTTK